MNVQYVITLIYTLIALNAAAAVRYVAANGSDAAPGTRENPFATIQKAAVIMKPGDLCIIRGGTYRETVRPAANGTLEQPIIFRAADGERVTVSGLDTITGFSRGSGNSVEAPMQWDLGKNNQVFAAGRMLYEARHPNCMDDDPLTPEGMEIDAEKSDVSNIVCPDLPDGISADDLSGATVWVLAQLKWSSWTLPVAGYDPLSKTIKLDGYTNWWVAANHDPGKRGSDTGMPNPNVCSVSGSRALLDAPNEWWYDAKRSMLVLWRVDGSVPENIEAKRRTNAFDLTGRSNIRIESIDIIGATIDLSDTADCVVSNARIRYVSHTRGGRTMSSLGEKSGIYLSGSGNVIRDSEIAYSAGNGITISGESNAVVNCFIHDIDYLGCYAAPVSMAGVGHLVAHNTIRDTGRDCIFLGGAEHIIEYNDISRAGRHCHDLGAIYRGGNDGGNTEIRYNLVHDVTGGMGQGIYLDNYTRNYIVHHNVTWNTEKGIQLNQPGNCVMVFHNTLFSRLEGTYSPWQGPVTMFGSLIANNLFPGEPVLKSGYRLDANIIHAMTVPQGAFDQSQCIFPAGVDKGVILEGMGDFTGSAPDCGAFEGPPFRRAGHDFARPPVIERRMSGSFHRNYLVNASFEYSRYSKIYDTLHGWTKTHAKLVTVKYFDGFNYPAADARFSVHAQSVMFSGDTDDGIMQAVSGLRPGTEYVFAVYIRAEDAKDVVIAVKHGRSETSSRYSVTETAVWRHIEVPFVSEGTEAVVSIVKTGAGTAYGDDAALVPVYRSGIVVTNINAAAKPRSIPLPGKVSASALPDDVKKMLQALFDSCWTPEELARRSEGIARRGRQGSESWKEFQPQVEAAHREANDRFVKKAREALSGDELDIFLKAMGR